ncbi:tetratricopeptide repeat protein [Brevundimonas sp.]|uniref:tetratricopeptide repeat protein n=1 Tax=Brevundimonas sp. TaxID=1871086 RepID=UPI002D44C8ED|nr:tetratricopeptide repeat protein [Brevundimonas sp.]HYC68716.1 tetratricopeptide repeat protein [Brevundimonas sp.]
MKSGVVVTLWALGALAGQAHAQSLGELNPGQTVDGTLDSQDDVTDVGGYFDCFQVNVAPGEEIVVTLSSAAFTPFLTVTTGCDGEVTDAGRGVRGGSSAEVTLRKEGEFPPFLRVMSRGAPVTGAYRLVAGGQARPAASDGQIPDAEIEALARACIDKTAELRRQAIAACTTLSADRRYRGAGLAERGQRKFEGGDAAGAMADLNEAVTVLPTNFMVWAARGNVKAALEDWAGSLSDYDEALRLAPEDAELKAQRASVRIAAGQFDAGLAEVNTLIGAYPGAAQLYRLKAEALHGLGRLDEALASQDLAVNLSPDGVQYLYRSSLRLQADRFPGAIEDADRAAQLSPDASEAQNMRCWTRAVANTDLATARTACDRSLALEPDNAAVLDSRGLVGLRQGRFQDAWNDYAAAVRLAPDDGGYLYGRGLAALRLGRRDEGRADLVTALGLNPEVASQFAAWGLRP